MRNTTQFTPTKQPKVQHLAAALCGGLMLLLTPYSVSAGPRALKDILLIVTGFLDVIVGFILVLALLAFVMGVIKFIATAGDDKSRADGRRLMIWGTVALFFMVSIWGIVRIIKLSFFGAL